jgi:DNA-binding LytR/AlgR family response regulator
LTQSILTQYFNFRTVLPPREELVAHAPTCLNDRIFVHHRDRLVRVLLADIKYIQAERAYCRIVTAGKTFLLSISLGALERQLVGDLLLRVHRSFVVNLRYIEEVDRNSLVVDGTCIPINRSRRKVLGRYVRLLE